MSLLWRIRVLTVLLRGDDCKVRSSQRANMVRSPSSLKGLRQWLMYCSRMHMLLSSRSCVCAGGGWCAFAFDGCRRWWCAQGVRPRDVLTASAG